jgi:hypothetical protein
MGLADSRLDPGAELTHRCDSDSQAAQLVGTNRTVKLTKDITFPVIFQTCDRARKPVYLWNLVDLKRLRWEGADALTPSKHSGRYSWPIVPAAS